MYSHILIADDSATSRMIIQRCLQIVGLSDATFYEAGDGIEALDILTRHKEIDLIVTDINMPKMNGLDLLRHLKSDPRLKQIPVIIISTESGQSTVMEAVELGAAGFIRKPFTSDQIRDKLAAFC